MDDATRGGDAIIHLRVPAALKARWVRESRAAGMKLTDWIVKKTEQAMNIETLLAAVRAAEKTERAATAAHDAAETHGVGPEYEAAFEAMAQARADLQAAEDAYDAAYQIAEYLDLYGMCAGTAKAATLARIMAEGERVGPELACELTGKPDQYLGIREALRAAGCVERGHAEDQP